MTTGATVQQHLGPLVVAHRGASALAPENTLAAVRKAMELGADVIEIDVRLTADKQLVVLHDQYVERTSNGNGNVAHLDFVTIRSFDAGSWFSAEYAGEKIPSLIEVIQLVQGKAKLLIEIKPNPGLIGETEKQLVEHLSAHKATDWCIVQSFDAKVIKNMKKLLPEIELHQLVTGYWPTVSQSQPKSLIWHTVLKYRSVAAVNMNYRFVKHGIVSGLHRRGQKIFVWTVDDPEMMEKLIDLKVDGIITNYPNRMLEMLRAKGYR